MYTAFDLKINIEDFVFQNKYEILIGFLYEIFKNF